MYGKGTNYMIKPYVRIPKTMETDLVWTDGLKFISSTSSKHQIILDASPEHGGHNEGARPMEAILTALGGCTGMDLVTILKKRRRNLQNLRIKLHGQRASSHPHVFRQITMEYILWGSDILDDDVQWALKLSLEKYSSVAAMLKKSCKLNFKWRIHKDRVKADKK
jgi:putative redox protein